MSMCIKPPPPLSIPKVHALDPPPSSPFPHPNSAFRGYNCAEFFDGSYLVRHRKSVLNMRPPPLQEFKAVHAIGLPEGMGIPQQPPGPSQPQFHQGGPRGLGSQGTARQDHALAASHLKIRPYGSTRSLNPPPPSKPPPHPFSGGLACSAVRSWYIFLTCTY